MKKIITLITTLFIVIYLLSSFSFAFSDSQRLYDNNEINIISSETIMQDDGYIVIEFFEITTKTQTKASNKTGSKHITKYDDDDDLVWDYTLTGTFSYNGTTSTCTNASYKTEVNSSSWSFSNCSATASGNQAIGIGTVKRKLLFITLDTIDINITITCDRNGNLS